MRLITAVLSFVIPCAAADLKEALDAYVSRSLAGDFSGTVLIAKGQQIQVLRSYGLAERNLKVANQPDTIYRIGSLTKPFTATAVLKLVQDGRVRLTDSICDRIQSCPPAWRGVTVENLLDHTSGIHNLFNSLRAVPVLETRKELARVIAAGEHLALESAPGSTYRYSNFNYILLGALIEEVTGTAWEEFLQKTIFSRADLKSTRYDDVWSIVPGRASGYVRKGGEYHPIAYKDHAAYAVGGLLSSATDLFHFVRALFGGRLIDEKTLAEMTRPRLGNYGLGLQIVELNGRPAYNHTGGIDGFSSHLQYYPREALTIIVLSNTEDEPVKKIATEIAALALNTN